MHRILMSIASTFLLSTLGFGFQEEDRDWMQDWLDKDVKYIIQEEEREVFLKLTSDSEREAFIEQFWNRRDPNPSTRVNEYRDEHYRRLAYANERFKSGVPGWATDRGRIYIMFGPPDEIRSHVGGHYQRPSYEGGGRTQVFPFEVWRYNHLEGIGSDVEIEFVDPTMTGEFRLAMSPEEKDALLHVSGLGGATWAEEKGLIDRGDRIMNQYRADPKQSLHTRRLGDMPFERLRRLFEISRPPEIRFKDLQQAVTSRTHFQELPASVTFHYFRLSEDDLLVAVTMKVEDRYLEFEKEAESNKAALDVYGTVSSIGGQIVYEFDDTVSTSLKNLAYLNRAQSIYQHKLSLIPGLYKLDLAIRDRNSGRIGTFQQGLSLPSIEDDKLATSSVVLARGIDPVDDLQQIQEPFVLGAHKVLPQVDRRFWAQTGLKIYFEIYEFAVDSSSLGPDLDVTYQVSNQKGELILEQNSHPDDLEYFGDRVIAIKDIELVHSQSGPHRLKVTIFDRISGHSKSQSVDFDLFVP